ncbi:hypothetical protein C0992_004195, partial [Termitomyces sp. T32_za158]
NIGDCILSFHRDAHKASIKASKEIGAVLPAKDIAHHTSPSASAQPAELPPLLTNNQLKRKPSQEETFEVHDSDNSDSSLDEKHEKQKKKSE